MTTEVAIRQHDAVAALDVQSGQDQAIERLIRWAEAAGAAHQLAQRLCVTKFVPVQYRNKPEEAAAAILAGAEVGLSPVVALRAFDDIQGTPAPKAITLRAIAQANGHIIRITESTPDRAVVRVRRKGENEWQESVWTTDRAQQMGLLEKDQWKKQRQAMLVARATSEGARWVASDAIMGMPYSAEEIRDDPALLIDGTIPVAQRVTAAEILADAAPTTTAPAVAAEPEADDTNTAGMVTRKQQNRMFALWSDLGYSGDDNRGQRLQITEKILGLPHASLESSNDLTEADADKVIEALQTRKDQQSGGGA